MSLKVKVKLNDLANIVDCEHRTAPIQEVGIPSIRTPNIGKGHLILDNVNRVSDEVYKKWTKRAIPEYPDLILAREAPVGNVAIIPKGLKVCLGQRTVLIRPKKELINPEYLNYLLSCASMNNLLLALSNGATVGHLNVDDIRKLPLPGLPEMAVQKKIAAILSAYDDLIENNNRRIAILEKMAEEIYKEWFVRMRFPGHEKISFVKGLPDNWHIKTIGDVCKKITDGSHFSPPEKDIGIPMASVKDMESNGFSFDNMKIISEEDFKKLQKSDCVPMINDILIAKDGSYLKHVFVWSREIEVALLSSIAILRPDLKRIKPYFFALMLKQQSTKAMMSGFVSGSALPRIILKDFKKMKLLIPEIGLIEKFEEIVQVFYKQINFLGIKKQNLKQTRDRLLTRLISGKLSVADLDIRFPRSMKEESDAELYP